MYIYILQSNKLNFLKHSYFYKLVCMVSEDSDQLNQSSPHALYKIFCFFFQIAQTDQVAEMCRLIPAFTEHTCYFAEINVISFFSTCQKLWNYFSIVYCIFNDKICFPVLSIINHYLLKSEGHYFYTLNPWERKKNKEKILFFPENRIWHFMHIISIGDHLNEMSNTVLRGK